MTTMKAVVFKGPKVVEIEDRPVPKIKDPTDVICRVEYSALCGRLALPQRMSSDHTADIITMSIASSMCSAGISPVPLVSSWVMSLPAQ